MGGDPRAARARRRHRRRRVGQDHPDGRARGLPGGHRAGPSRPGARPDLHHQGREPAPGEGPRGTRGRRPAPRAERGHRRHPRADGGDLQRLRGRAPHRPRPADRSRARLAGAGGRLALPARCSGGGTAHGRGAVPHRPPADRHPEPPRPRQRHERAPRLAGAGARGRRRGRARVPPRGRRGARRQGAQDLSRRHGEGHQRDRAPPRADGAGPRLPPDQAGPRADGLLRPDRARRPAGRGAAGRRCPGARAVPRRAPRRVSGHLGRPGDDAVPSVLAAAIR